METKRITLANLAQATKQEVFDQVAKHLMKQGKQSTVWDAVAELERCVYHGPNGLMCAAGCLISDDEYEKNFEGRSWRSLVTESAVPSAHRAIITQLQEIHDNCPPELWLKKLRNCAQSNNLSTAILE